MIFSGNQKINMANLTCDRSPPLSAAHWAPLARRRHLTKEPRRRESRAGVDVTDTRSLILQPCTSAPPPPLTHHASAPFFPPSVLFCSRRTDEARRRPTDPRPLRSRGTRPAARGKPPEGRLFTIDFESRPLFLWEQRGASAACFNWIGPSAGPRGAPDKLNVKKKRSSGIALKKARDGHEGSKEGQTASTCRRQHPGGFWLGNNQSNYFKNRKKNYKERE